MNFNRRPFQFSPDFGSEHASGLFRDHFDEPFEAHDMFSEGASPGRWDTADMPRFHVPGFGHDFGEGFAFNRPVGSTFSRPRSSAFGEIPIKTSHQRSGSGDASDTESRASGSSDGSTGTTRAVTVRHIPIHVEQRSQRNDQAGQQPAGIHHPFNQQPQPMGQNQADMQYKQEEAPPSQQHQQPSHQYQYRQTSPPKREFEQRNVRSSTPQYREGSPHHFSTLPQFRDRTFSDQMLGGKARSGVQIPVKVERSDSSPVIGDERFTQRKSTERGPEAQVNTGTFPRAKNYEAPLRWFPGFFKGPRPTEQPSDPRATSPPPPQPEPAPPQQQQPVQKTPVSPQERIDKVLSDLVDLNDKVDAFEGTDQKAKEYRFLDEMLTRLMLSLDDVVTDGNETLRAARRSAIKEVQRVVDKLERIVQANADAAQQKRQQTPQQQQQQQPPQEQYAASAPVEAAPSATSTVTSASANVKQKEPSPPKREKSPSKKRLASPVKGDTRSPSPKKDAGVNTRQRSVSPTKRNATGTNGSRSTTSGGVSVTVNGVPHQATPSTSSTAAADSAPSGGSETSGDTTTSTAGTAQSANDTQAGEPATPEPILSTATIELK